MPLKFFTVPIHDAEAAEAEVNAFIANHRVLTVERRWVDLGAGSFWALCVDYLAGSSGASEGRGDKSGRNRVDYKEILSPEEFAVFAALREVRKEIAQAEAVPVYTVLTNQQLAAAVQQRVKTPADLTRIEGIGAARIEKYAARLLPLLAQLPEPTDATDGESI